MVADVLRPHDDFVVSLQQVASRRRKEMGYSPVHYLPGLLV